MKTEKEMKTQEEMQTLIINWAKRVSKKFNMDCLVTFEDKDNRSFYLKYDGFIHDCLFYAGGLYANSIKSFNKMFDGTGWEYDYYNAASVMVVHKEG